MLKTELNKERGELKKSLMKNKETTMTDLNINEIGRNFYYHQDCSTFTYFYTSIRPFLINWASKKYHINHDKSQDIVDESLEKLYTKIKQYDPCYNFQNWMFQIVSNDFNKYYNHISKKEVQFSEPPTFLENYLTDEEYINKDEDESEVLDRVYDILLSSRAPELFGRYYQYRIDLFLEYVSGKMTYDSLALKYHMNKSSVVKYILEIRRVLYKELKDNKLNRIPNYNTESYDKINKQVDASNTKVYICNSTDTRSPNLNSGSFSLDASLTCYQTQGNN